MGAIDGKLIPLKTMLLLCQTPSPKAIAFATPAGRPSSIVTERQWPGAARSPQVASGTAGSQRPQQARARPGVLGGLTGLPLRLDSEPPHAPPPPPPQGCLQTRQVASEGPSPHGCQCLQLTLDAGSRHARPGTGRPGTGPGPLPC
jgi:hypothetical protein